MILSLAACSDGASSPKDSGPDSPAGSAMLTATPAMHDFGNVRSGDSTAPFQMITVVNVGSLSTGPIGAQLSFTDAALFRIVGNGCNGGIVAPLGECSMQVQFRPDTPTGGKEARLTIYALPGGEVVVPLAGTAVVDDRPRLAPNNSMATFGERAIGSASAPFTFTITNPGVTATGAIAVQLAGANPTAFGLTTNCSAPLAPAGTCMVAVGFRPTAAQLYQAQVMMSATPGSSIMLDVSGTGIDTALSASPTSGSFGSVAAGVFSTAQTFTFTNTGTHASGSVSATFTGANPGDFTMGSSNCTGNSLAPGASCTVDVRFFAQSLGAKSTTLLLDASGATASVPLTGTGI